MRRPGRLARGELRQLVLAHVSCSQTPVGAGVVAGALGRSCGAVGNALERLADAEGLIVRAFTPHRRYGPLPDLHHQHAHQSS